MSFPPHLPAPICDIASHRKWQRIKILLAATVFGLVAGICGAAIMLGWLWPGWGGGDDWMVSRVNNSWLNRTQLAEKVRLETADRIATVYARVGVGYKTGYLASAEKIGDAVVIASDGWLAMRYAGNTAGFKSWQVLLNGEVYKISQLLVDSQTALLYLKLAENKNVVGRDGVQFKIVSFEDKLSQVGDEVYVLQNSSWQYTVVKQIFTRGSVVPHTDFAPLTYYAVNTEVAAGEVVIDKFGKIIGIATDNSAILPIRYLTRVLADVLAKKNISYPSYGLEGWFDFEQPIIWQNKTITGFLVTKGNGVVRGGDVIVELNGQIVNEDNLWYNLNNANTARAKINRAGEILEVELTPKDKILQ